MKFTKTVLLAASVAMLAGIAEAETLTIQTSLNADDFSTQYLTENWLPKTSERTEGRVEIVFAPNGSVVPARDTPEAVSAGVLDGGFTAVS
jgi:TRAP-type C4-dicarboxylate transport system substrate-binding protein